MDYLSHKIDDSIDLKTTSQHPEVIENICQSGIFLSFIYTPEKDRTERSIPQRQEGLIYKDIDLFKLRNERKKWEKEQLKEKKFIQSTRT